MGLDFSLLYSGTYERMPKQPTNKGFSYLWLWFFKLSILSNVIWRSKYILIKIFKALYTCIFSQRHLGVMNMPSWGNSPLLYGYFGCKILRRSFCRIAMNHYLKLTLFGAFNLTIGFQYATWGRSWCVRSATHSPQIYQRYTELYLLLCI